MGLSEIALKHAWGQSNNFHVEVSGVFQSQGSGSATVGIVKRSRIVVTQIYCVARRTGVFVVEFDVGDSEVVDDESGGVEDVGGVGIWVSGADGVVGDDRA